MGREQFGGGPANALARGGDQGGFPGEALAHGRPSQLVMTPLSLTAAAPAKPSGGAGNAVKGGKIAAAAPPILAGHALLEGARGWPKTTRS